MQQQQEPTTQDHVHAAQTFLARAQLSGAEAPTFTEVLGWLDRLPSALEVGTQAALDRDRLAAELKELKGEAEEDPIHGPDAGID